MDEIQEQDVICPFTGKEHTVVGSKATMCPTREVVKKWIREARREK